jgi:hypothetical protein
MCKNKFFQSSMTKNELFKVQRRKTNFIKSLGSENNLKNSFDFRHFFKEFDKCYLFLKFKIRMGLPQENLVVSYSESGVGQANESYQIPTQVMRAVRTLTFNSQCTTIFTIMKRLEKL